MPAGPTLTCLDVQGSSHHLLWRDAVHAVKSIHSGVPMEKVGYQYTVAHMRVCQSSDWSA